MTAFFSHTVHFIDFQSTDRVVLRGSINANFPSHRTIWLVLQKRKTNLYYAYPLTWLNANTWEAVIDFGKDGISRGTWDYYLQSNENEKYRLKIEDESILDWNSTSIVKNSEATYELSFYITTKSSLSSKVYAPVVKLSALQREWIDHYTLKLTGSIESDEYINQDSLPESAIIIKERGTEKTYKKTFVTHQPAGDNFHITFDLNYMDIMTEVYQDTQWDLYIQIRKNNCDYLFRLQLQNEKNLKKDTYADFDDHDMFQIYFYATIKNNLSISLAPIKIQQDVISSSIKNHHIHFECLTSFSLMNPDRLKDLTTSIIVRKRHSKKEASFAVMGQKITESTDNGTQARFSAAIPMKKIFALQEEKNSVYDFYIQFNLGNWVYEKSLSCKEYEFYVDAPIADDTSNSRLYGMRNFLLLTPGGKFKLEVYAYSLLKISYLIYGQRIDQKQQIGEDIWLIGERPDTAQDTGFHFFKYCRNNFPEKNIYYVIEEDSADYKNIKELGNVIFYGSWQHFKKTAKATTFIGSHDLEYILPTKATDWPSYQKGNRVFLQHGILGRKKVDYYKQNYRYPFNLFLVSSQSESDLVKHEMGYDDQEIKITGLSRFDSLVNNHNEEQSIAVIPTWRDWLNENNFSHSEYYITYKSLISDPRLYKLLKSYNLQLSFYPHYRMQHFIEDFRDLENDRIRVVRLSEMNVQKLLKRNRLLITDFSTVSFDFNYMSKPVIFYHFDHKRFFKNGVLRPIEETFLGDINQTKEDVINSIERYIQRGFKEDKTIHDKKPLVFDHIDGHNNERIFSEIEKLTRN